MAIAETLGHQYLSRFKQFRGKGTLGTAVGAGLGLAYTVGDYYEWTWPWSQMLQPERKKQGGFGLKDESSYQQRQAYHTIFKRRYSKRRAKRPHNDCCCCKINSTNGYQYGRRRKYYQGSIRRRLVSKPKYY